MPRLSTALPIPPRNVPVPKHTLVRIVSVIAVLLVGHTIAVAQTVPGDAARGQGSYLNGLGWYNLNTAKANSINVDATIRWKQDLRQIQLDRWDLVANQNAKKAAGKKLKIEEVKYQQLVRLRQLRVEPTAADVETGDALNVLLYDLTDPDISQESWANTSQQVKLPEGMSVKDLVFRFTSLKGSSATSAALSKGVIALSRLAVAGDKWPTPLQVPEIQKERAAYEAAYAKVRDQILAGQFDLKAVQAMDRSLDALNEKVKTDVPAERGFRTEAAKFVSDLKDSTRMFDAATVDYAREILNDTKDHDATTVAELVAFMLKYRLQFASAERSPGAREIYTPLFEALQEQHKAFGIKVPEVPEMAEEESEAIVANSVWVGDKFPHKLTITERNGETFQARFEVPNGFVREVKGEVKGNKLSWLAKDARAVKGRAGGDNHGTIGRDENGDKIDFVWRDGDGSGTFTLRLQK